MGATVFYLLMLQKYINSKKKILKQRVSLVFRKDFSANNMKKRIKWVCVQFYC